AGKLRERDAAVDRLPAPVHRVELQLAGLLGREHGPHRLAEPLDRQADVEAEEVLAVGLVRPEAPELLSTAVPGRDLVVAVDRDDRGLQSGKDRAQERVRRVKLLGAYLDLVVDRLELLVRGLELLVHRLELLVRRLELLVRRL